MTVPFTLQSSSPTSSGFALTTPDEDITKAIYDIIGKCLMLPDEDKHPFAYTGLVHNYNGIQVKQPLCFYLL